MKALFYGLMAFIISLSYILADQSPFKKGLSSPMQKSYQTLSNHQIAKSLGWIFSGNTKNLCRGFFKEPKRITEKPHPPPLNTNTTWIRSDGPNLLASSGRSVLNKNVVAIQPGRLIKADHAYIDRDEKTGRMTQIELIGHVLLEQKDRLVRAQRAYLNVSTHALILYDSLYHINYINPQDKKRLSAWGKAQYVKHLRSGITDFDHHVTYTTCSPLNPTWELQASSMHLDKKKGVGTAYNVVLRIHHIPVLFMPYYSFALDHQRKSGFLAPTLGYSHRTGVHLALPYYWNIAPNYDAFITSELISKRGFQLSALFRFLTHHSEGHLFTSLLPDDRLFAQFKQNIINSVPRTPSNEPYLQALNNSGHHRWKLGFQDHTQLSSHWFSDINLNRVSDDYYFNDFSRFDNSTLVNQLLNQADVQYRGQHWHFTALMQGYQTLHPFNQAPTQDQYRRLPELDLSFEYPLWQHYFDVHMESSLVNFNYQSALTEKKPRGKRLHARPGMSLPLTWTSAFITPSLYLDHTDYIVDHPLVFPVHKITRTLPILSLDSGLYFQRRFYLRHEHYIQTLEPELFYLYVPYKNQSAIPNYDTYLLPLTYNQLFSLNRFSGDDRLQNANQVSLGVTSRLFNSRTGSQTLQFDLGAVYYVTLPQVGLTLDSVKNTSHLSPIVGDAIFYPAKNWSANASMAWDTHLGQTNNASLTLTYRRDNQHILNLGYLLVHNMGTAAYSDITAGLVWPMNYHWSALGYHYYNLSEHRADRYYLGVQYSTCCWSLRFISQRSYTGINVLNRRNQYQTGYYVQLQLKGLGSLGQNNNNLLISTIPGYNAPL